ncbi:hypothetical protein BDBG_17208 [Blastomyces gilchristii SLH14081]|uniref:Uncharacterized protein n=1 Tax=Blastomyces gilchristii (strain SLH14081) TaxID=559298 RepID=A0A179UN61_BLAGS|nr:uncharacterized protein BDBG_17208 [Blastomyces gilchristii SLH14081]OAT09414.1 hypothetical protein BDBG_17208 [Blastomyces gilchristii SLH14081]
MQIQQYAVFKHLSFYLLYELHPRIPENASEKMGEGTAVADAAETVIADALVMNAAETAVADTTVTDAEPRLKEISHTHAKANKLLLN